MITENANESVSCCDKSVSAGKDACCAEDVAAKAAGNQACECMDNNNELSESRATCC
jgi:hypothetical protein